MKVIAISAAIEIVAGLFLIVDPSLFASLVLHAALSDSGQAVGRVGGFGLFALGLACWPGNAALGRNNHVLRGLLVYNSLATIFFVYLGIRGEFVGVLLWPAALIHGILAIAMSRIYVAKPA